MIDLLWMKVSRDWKQPHQFDKLMRISENKINLMKFLVNGLQIPSMQRFWKIKNSMLQLRTRGFAYFPMVTSCEWCFETGYQVSRMKLAQCFYMHNSLLILDLNIVIVDTDVAVLRMYFQSMFDGKIYLLHRTLSATMYDLSENSLYQSLV